MSTNTQNKAIREHLEAGYSLTPVDAVKLCRCRRLASRVCELKRAGMRISRRMIEVPGHDGTVARVAEYFLEQESAEGAEERNGTQTTNETDTENRAASAGSCSKERLLAFAGELD